MRELTKRQKEYLICIMDFIEKFSYPPTWSELAAHAGIKNFDGNNYSLAALEAKGYVTWMRGGKRSIRVLKDIHGRKVRLAYEVVNG